MGVRGQELLEVRDCRHSVMTRERRRENGTPMLRVARRRGRLLTREHVAITVLTVGNRRPAMHQSYVDPAPCLPGQKIGDILTSQRSVTEEIYYEYIIFYFSRRLSQKTRTPSSRGLRDEITCQTLLPLAHQTTLDRRKGPRVTFVSMIYLKKRLPTSSSCRLETSRLDCCIKDADASVVMSTGGLVLP